MTRPPDLPDPYRLERELKLVMNPEPSRPPSAILALKVAGFFLAEMLIGLGILIGLIVFCGFASCFWVMRKMWGRK